MTPKKNMKKQSAMTPYVLVILWLLALCLIPDEPLAHEQQMRFAFALFSSSFFGLSAYAMFVHPSKPDKKQD